MTLLARKMWLSAVAMDSRMTLPAVRVAAALEARHNDKTGQCNPSLETIGTDIAMAVRTVREALSLLHSTGFINRIIHPGREQTNDYVLAWDNRHNGAGYNQDNRRNGAAIDPVKPAPLRTKTGAVTSLKPAPLRPQNSVKELREELGRENSPAAAAPDDGLGDVLQRLRGHRNRSGESILPEWETLADEYGVPAIATALPKLAPKDRWPSRVRVAITDALDGNELVFAERTVTADDARAALGLGDHHAR